MSTLNTKFRLFAYMVDKHLIFWKKSQPGHHEISKCHEMWLITSNQIQMCTLLKFKGEYIHKWSYNPIWFMECNYQTNYGISHKCVSDIVFCIIVVTLPILRGSCELFHLQLRESNSCRSASKVSVRDIIKIDQYETATEQKRTVNNILGRYSTQYSENWTMDVCAFWSGHLPFDAFSFSDKAKVYCLW